MRNKNIDFVTEGFFSGVFLSCFWQGFCANKFYCHLGNNRKELNCFVICSFLGMSSTGHFCRFS